jgi:hypothetical protein
MQFCPQCGKVVKGSDAESEIVARQEEFNTAVREGHRNWLIFIISIYAMPVIILGVMGIMEASSLAHTVYFSEEFQDWISSHGYAFTLADVENYLTYAAALILGSGICAMITVVCLAIRKMWIVAVIACLISAMLCFWSVIGLVIGLLVAWQIFGSKDIFTEDA